MKICSVDLNKDMQPLMQVDDQLPGPHLLILSYQTDFKSNSFYIHFLTLGNN